MSRVTGIKKLFIVLTATIGISICACSIGYNNNNVAHSKMTTSSSQEAEYAHRRATLAATCRRLGYPERTSLADGRIPQKVLVERNHSILYCPITKVGSTFWLRTLSVMTRRSGELTSPFEIIRTEEGLVSYGQFARNMSLRQQDEFRKQAMSFLFIRDPYTRLYSAYMNKLYNAQWYFWKIIGLPIVRHIRKSARHVQSYGDDVTFAELIKFILRLDDKDKRIDIHFVPMHTMCDPCDMAYGFIGKLETFKDDAQYLLAEWKRKFPNIPVTFDDFEKETIIDLAKGYLRFLFETYDHMKAKNYPLYKLLLRMWKDLQIRGRLAKSIPMPLSEQNASTVTQESFVKLVEHALDDPANRNRKQVALQQQEALVEAYRSVSADDMERLRKYVSRDCQLFGYDDRPSALFDRNGSLPAHNDGQFRYFT